MLKFAMRRIGASLLILLGVTVFLYALLLAAPGGPEQKYANNPRFTPQQQQAYVKALGLDKPVPVQYCRWLGACRRDADGIEALIGPQASPVSFPRSSRESTRELSTATSVTAMKTGMPLLSASVAHFSPP
jgi:peptide/nickel transport system permease protein